MTLQIESAEAPATPSEVSPSTPLAAIQGSTYEMDGDLCKMASDLAKVADQVGRVQSTDKADIKPGFSYTYAGLPTVIAAVKPALSALDIALIQVPLSSPKGGGATTHVIGQGWRMSCTVFFSMGQSSPQAIGSTQTYARRYALLGLFALAPDDDDGKGDKAQQAYQQRQGQRQQQRDERQGRGSKPVDPTVIAAAFLKLGVKEEALVAEIGGNPLGKVTEAQTRHLRVLMQRLNAGEGVEDVFSEKALEVIMAPKLTGPDPTADGMKREVHGQPADGLDFGAGGGEPAGYGGDA